MHSESKLWLIFEWVDQDLKKYMNSCKNDLEPMLIKARTLLSCCLHGPYLVGSFVDLYNS